MCILVPSFNSPVSWWILLPLFEFELYSIMAANDIYSVNISWVTRANGWMHSHVNAHHVQAWHYCKPLKGRILHNLFLYFLSNYDRIGLYQLIIWKYVLNWFLPHNIVKTSIYIIHDVILLYYLALWGNSTVLN